VQENKLTGIAPRAELTEALAERRAPKLAPIIRCQPRQTIRELQTLLIESPTGVALVCDDENGKLLGLVTLHDLLRAQTNAAQNSV
jgi:CBS domain-containing protein